jgi:RND family efflux transporter MFP subunit
MDTLRRWLLVLVVGVLCAGLAHVPTRTAPAGPPVFAGRALAADEKAVAAPLEVVGRTRVPLTHKGAIAATVLRPVVEVLAAPGDRVKKGQVIIRLDDREAQAKVKGRAAALESARINLKAARNLLGRAEDAWKKGVLPDVRYLEMRNAVLKDEMEERAAQADLASARVELEFYAIKAPLDGTVAWLEAYPGVVAWPGSSVWGDVVDLKVLDVHCDLTAAQAEGLEVGRQADVAPAKGRGTYGVGKVVFVGNVADRRTGLVPVVLRLANPRERVRAGVAVAARFRAAPGR